ncbi:hypothetical protein [Campylobacter helveticus]|uniref:Coiled-coil protein n=1 Tax=Campylobacter helveticus TaxID=28898 RepID=A0AAX2UKE5_9BACT|nr:hypothetical protein [Campylobacter helveticus]ARE80804.1 hypothetical protein CHELV3228_1222 [Campylobacter helveticus]MCR2039467.1 hypothetical protein [Campylobacter helveticus]MCR2054491.1 hypothetical protein [Campylobacter helveticus]MCR2060029.1 hypothetical protein [Campylobacter helveticus]MCR2061460.1 hypothetical protein [Campylobacter helveticus]
MPVSPIGNMNYINQNMAYPATQMSNELAKEGFAANVNLSEFMEKEKAIEKLEKVAKSHEVDEEIKEKAEEEEKKKKREKEEESKEEEENSEEESGEEDGNLEQLSEENVAQFKKAQNFPHIDISI